MFLKTSENSKISSDIPIGWIFSQGVVVLPLITDSSNYQEYSSNWRKHLPVEISWDGAFADYTLNPNDEITQDVSLYNPC